MRPACLRVRRSVPWPGPPTGTRQYPWVVHGVNLSSSPISRWVTFVYRNFLPICLKPFPSGGNGAGGRGCCRPSPFLEHHVSANTQCSNGWGRCRSSQLILRWQARFIPVGICRLQDSRRAWTRVHGHPFVLRCASFPVPPLPPAATRGFPISIRSRITAKSARLVTAVLTVFNEVCMVHFPYIHFRPRNHVTLSVQDPRSFGLPAAAVTSGRAHKDPRQALVGSGMGATHPLLVSR